MSLCFVLLGHPVAHSLSPAIHGAAYATLGLDARYELVDAPDEAAVARSVDALRRGELAGANVTVPWKQVALALADRTDVSAADVGAANVLVHDASGVVVAYNTDVPALAVELAELIAARPPRRGGPDGAERVLVLGAGGAALAAVAAARQLGAARVAVTARRFDLGCERSLWPNAAALVRLGAELLPWGSGAASELATFAKDATLVVQATSAGMHGGGPGAEVAEVVPWSSLGDAAAYDLVYTPSSTPFLTAARARGLVARGGLGMLVGQAALAFELWLGKKAPRAAMERAAEVALARRQA